MIQQISENIWLASFEVHPGLGIILPACTVFIEYRPKELLMISPGKLTPEDVQQISDIGEVKAILAPNLVHHLSMPDAIRGFPNAKIFLAPGLEKKRSDLQVSGFSQPAFQQLMGPQFDFLVMDSMEKINEVILYDKRSKTLVVTDLLFNILHPKNLLTRLILTIMGTNGKLNVSRLMKRKISDRDSYFLQIERILKWDVENVVLSHGEPIFKIDKGLLRKVLTLKV